MILTERQQKMIELAIKDYLDKTGLTYDAATKQFALQPGEATVTISPSVIRGFVVNALLMDR